MHILILPSFYCDKDSPMNASFFKEQAQALCMTKNVVRVLFAEQRSIRRKKIISFFKENHFQNTFEIEDGIPTWRMHSINPQMTKYRGGLIWCRFIVMAFRKYCHRFGYPDIIHAHNGLWAGYAAFLLKQKYNIDYIITEHSSKILNNKCQDKEKFYLKISYDHASLLLSVGKKLASAMSKYTNKSVTVYANCVDTSMFHPLINTCTKTSFIFFSAGHLSKSKGYDILLKAFCINFRDKPNVKLKIAGEGALKKEYIELAKELNIDHQVFFLGELSRTQIAAEMMNADAFALASLFETFGVVFIEALACGLPIVGTLCGGPEDFITAQEGLLAKTDDVEDFANKMGLIYHRSKTFNKEKLSQFAKQKFDCKHFAEGLICYYNRICENKQ